MKLRSLLCGTVISSFVLVAAPAQTKSDSKIPHLEKRGPVTQLIVDGKPFLVLAGELHNSSSSSLEYMKPIWPRLVKMNLNTVLAVVSWEQVEPAEGRFDFTVVDGLLREARQQHLRLVILWFGSWKNGTSRYEADWVKTDQARFPRVVNKDGKSLEILSTLGEATREADAKAFAALMRHLRAVDAREHTVIMIQMQNEVGVLGDSRDRSPAANAAFARPVPKELLDYLQQHKNTLLPELRKIWDAAGNKTAGTWEEIFGKGTATDEIFQAWNYARFCNRVSEAGKAEYALPTFVNTWIVQPEDKGPGDYPSGGPQAHVHDLWRAGAPKIDILAPDIYLPDFPGILKMYSRSGNPVFIPESRAGAGGAANAFFAFGQFGAIGYSPFGIEAQEGENGMIPKAYAMLGQLAPLILEHQAKGSIAGVWLTREKPSEKVSLGNYTLNVELRKQRRSPASLPDLGYAICLATGPDEYVVSGSDVQVTFTPNMPGLPIVGLLSVEEGAFKDGKWIPGRRLNGDEVQLRYDLSVAAAENQPGTGLRFPAGAPGIQRVKLYRYR
jgi:hypothetical protein